MITCHRNSSDGHPTGLGDFGRHYKVTGKFVSDAKIVFLSLSPFFELYCI